MRKKELDGFIAGYRDVIGGLLTTHDLPTRRWTAGYEKGREVAEGDVFSFGRPVYKRLLRDELARQVVAALHSDVDGTTSLAGLLGEAIADVAGMWSLEFVTPEQLAQGIAAWLKGEA